MDEHCNKTIVKRFIRNMTVHALRAVFQKTLFICRVRSGALGTFIVVDRAAHSRRSLRAECPDNEVAFKLAQRVDGRALYSRVFF